VVVAITFGKATIFLLADAQGPDEALDEEKQHGYTLVKIAHHGSHNGKGALWLTYFWESANLGLPWVWVPGNFYLLKPDQVQIRHWAHAARVKTAFAVAYEPGEPRYARRMAFSSPSGDAQNCQS
jgi:hypothetical protein